MITERRGDWNDKKEHISWIIDLSNILFLLKLFSSVRKLLYQITYNDVMELPHARKGLATNNKLTAGISMI